MTHIGEPGDMMGKNKNAQELKFDQLQSMVADLTAILRELQARNDHTASKSGEQVGGIDAHQTLVSLIECT